MTASKIIFTGNHVLVRERGGWEYVERKSATEAVAVVAIVDDAEVILVEQYRRAVHAYVIDFPAGLVEELSREETAKNELKEEAGYTCEKLEVIATGPSSPGITSEILTIYRARDVRKVGEGGGVDGEKIQVHLVPLGDVRRWLRQKQDKAVMIDLKVAMYFSAADRQHFST
ncbi:MAG: NUDIX hydrolase [Acidobacteria bacterium]|nr:NUDIX hydrolase [Acidobacteriota bacterium]